MKAALIRAQVESALEGRVLSPFIDRPQQTIEIVPTGVTLLDALTGGLPRGGLTEIFGPDSSGRTSLLHAILGSATGREEECALVDASDTFDPWSAPSAGVDLRRLLWVRCVNLEQTLKATDLLLAGGGFGLVAVDLGSVPPNLGRRVPLASWFRFRRVVEHTPTMLVFLEREPYAKTCATLVLRLKPDAACWTDSGVRDWKLETGNWKLDTRHSTLETRKGTPCGHPAVTSNSRDDCLVPRAPTRGAPTVSHARLLRGLRPKVEVVRSRLPNTAISHQLSAVADQL
jgi:recombination protein RecA